MFLFGEIQQEPSKSHMSLGMNLKLTKYCEVMIINTK